MNWCSLIALTLLTSTPGSTPALDKRPVVRVHVLTAHPAGDTLTEDERGLEDSAQDLRDLLDGRSGITIVASAAEAQVRIEVVNREERNAAQGGFGGRSLTPFRETIVRLRIETADAKGELKGIGRPSWKAAAKDAAERVEKWLKSHPPPGVKTSDSIKRSRKPE